MDKEKQLAEIKSRVENILGFVDRLSSMNDKEEFLKILKSCLLVIGRARELAQGVMREFLDFQDISKIFANLNVTKSLIEKRIKDLKFNAQTLENTKELLYHDTDMYLGRTLELLNNVNGK